MRSYMDTYGENKIVSLQILTLRESGMRGSVEYEAKSSDGVTEVSRYLIRYDHGEDVRVLDMRAECSTADFLKLCNDCDILSWDGFYGPHPEDVLDGIMFQFTAIVNDKKKIRANGSENFPAHYREFTNGLYEILDNG